MEASIKTILLEFKIFQDQMALFETEIISKIHENNPSEKLQIIYKTENPSVSYLLSNSIHIYDITYAALQHADNFSELHIT